MFCLPGSRIPDWFELCSSGESISFWFRGKFPAVALCLVPGSNTEFELVAIVIINGKNRDEFTGDYCLQAESDHTYIFNLEKIKFEDNLDEALLNNEWNHMEIMYKDRWGFMDPSMVMLIESGIHVFNEKSRIEDIRFTDPTLEERSYLEITNLQGKIILLYIVTLTTTLLLIHFALFLASRCMPFNL
jgi:hypothetical protein